MKKFLLIALTLGLPAVISSCEHETDDYVPRLEWMTENLSGFGGTEVDGHWYYTYDEAVEAVKQLGNGWRLPTREEFEALSDLGSTWDKETKGRWFGGNHDTDHKDSLFFSALGYRVSTTEALANVGTNGYYWSSSLYAADNAYAGYLSFDATNVLPLVITSRASGYPVRCVRDI